VALGIYGKRYVLLAPEEPEVFTIDALAADHPARPLGYTHRIVTTTFDGDVEEYGVYHDGGVAAIVRDALAEQAGWPRPGAATSRRRAPSRPPIDAPRVKSSELAWPRSGLTSGRVVRPAGLTHRIVTRTFDGDVEAYGRYRAEGVAEIARDAPEAMARRQAGPLVRSPAGQAGPAALEF
jgi:hypothetical protein